MTNESVVAHAQADIARLQISLYRIRLSSWRRRFQEIPGLWFSAVLTRVAPALVCAAHVIEEEHIHCRGAERSKFEVMRHHELVIGTVPPLEGQSFCLLIILLLRLFLPREEEAA